MPASRAGRNRASGAARRTSSRPCLRDVEVLEGRQLLATFSVTSLADAGAGSFRQAIVDSNARPGPDTIDFGVAGTIRVGRAALPAIRDGVTIDGATAPTFAGAPVVGVDFRGTRGLWFGNGADGSVLRGLSLVGAGDSGVTLVADGVTIEGNTIGLRIDGTAAGNRGDGIRITASSRGNLIGREDPVTSVSYFGAEDAGTEPVTGWQGIRDSDTAGQYLIAGTSNSDGLLYDGPIDGDGGTSYLVEYPGAATTSVYGPDNLDGDRVRLVGSYRTGEDTVDGFLFEGTTADLSNAANYRTIAYPGAKFNYVHSTMGGLAVGNYDGPTAAGAPIGAGRSYIYDVATGAFLTDIVFPGSLSNTAYGIWHNGGTSYTIAGGFSERPVNNLDDQRRPIGQGMLVDYDSATGQFSHWKSFSDPNGPVGVELATHFEGISSVEKGVYTLSAGSAQSGSTSLEQGSFVSVRRDPDGTFGEAVWVDLGVPGATGSTTSDSVIGNQVVGIYAAGEGIASYQATVNVGFQLSNVISGNGGNGIGVYGSDDNRIGMNYIGTDVSGTVARGNAGNGILVTGRASRNLIGGQATGGNDPTAGVIVRPPQGNLISGNRGNGVLINNGATRTLLSGNFVGTAASGTSPLGNRLDGVAVVNADGNALIGCTFQQSPFVFYNVLSGNGGNGLRITDSNNTTVQANFMGAGADNATVVANGGDGLLVSGSSSNTQVGGVIPLGNVISGNDRHGIEVRDTASGLISFNTFAGVFAFQGAAPNRLNGIQVTSTGGNNLIRTSIVSGNLGNGIEIGGRATGVQVTETAIGLEVTLSGSLVAVPNGGSGVRITGRAHGNAIGGFQPSIEPQVTISSNRRYGVEVDGRARDNVVYNTFIGTNFAGTADLGNELGGIYLGPGTSSSTIGGPAGPLRNKILNSGGHGVTIWGSNRNTLLGNEIQANAGAGLAIFGGRRNQVGSATAGNTISGNGQQGLYASGDLTGTQAQGNEIGGNAGDGVSLAGARRLTVGGTFPGAGNRIVGNAGFGLYGAGLCSGSLVVDNLIAANGAGEVDLSRSRGLTYIPRRGLAVD